MKKLWKCTLVQDAEKACWDNRWESETSWHPQNVTARKRCHGNTTNCLFLLMKPSCFDLGVFAVRVGISVCVTSRTLPTSHTAIFLLPLSEEDIHSRTMLRRVRKKKKQRYRSIQWAFCVWGELGRRIRRTHKSSLDAWEMKSQSTDWPPVPAPMRNLQAPVVPVRISLATPSKQHLRYCHPRKYQGLDHDSCHWPTFVPKRELNKWEASFCLQDTRLATTPFAN